MFSLSKIVDKFRKVHGDRYDYTNSIYKGYLSKMEIVCRKHGVFLQAPNSHINGSGCKKCMIEAQTKTTDSFIKEAIKTHGDRYDYSNTNYIDAKTNVNIICKVHGEFSQSPRSHIKGHNCILCSGTKKRTTDEFVKLSTEIHGSRYDYSNTHYINAQINVDIVCKVHGEFSQSPRSHLRGSDCPHCVTPNNIKDKPTLLYYLKINNGEAYKIGITSKSLDVRFKCDNIKIDVLYAKIFKTGLLAFNLEQKILSKFSCFKYQGAPLLKGGNSELFYKDVLGLDVLKST